MEFLIVLWTCLMGFAVIAALCDRLEDDPRIARWSHRVWR